MKGLARSIALDDLNQSDAYRANYNRSKMLPETIHHASVLAADDKITQGFKSFASNDSLKS